MRIYTTLLQMGLLLLLIGCSGIEGKYQLEKKIHLFEGLDTAYTKTFDVDSTRTEDEHDYIQLFEDKKFKYVNYYDYEDNGKNSWDGSYIRNDDTLKMEIYDKEKNPNLYDDVFPEGGATAQIEADTLVIVARVHPRPIAYVFFRE